MTDVPVSLNLADRDLKITFDLDSPVHQSILGELQEKGAYEPGTHLFLTRALRPGDTFVDIGSHIGYFSIMAAAFVRDTGKVIAVEPVAENFERLQGNIQDNNFKHVHIVNSVISDTDGEVEFHINKDNDGGHALWDPGLHPANEKSREAPQTEKLQSMTLSRLLDMHDCSHVRLMKIDTEGAEPQILRSAAEILKSAAIDFIIAEVNIGGLEIMGESIGGFFKLAQELGYVVCLPQDDGTSPVLLTALNMPDPKYVYNVLLARPEALPSLM